MNHPDDVRHASSVNRSLPPARRSALSVDLHQLAEQEPPWFGKLGYDYTLDEALAEMAPAVRCAWRERYSMCESAETWAEGILHRAEAALQVALTHATIRTIGILVANRAGVSGDDKMEAAVAWAGMAMGLRP